ncbi:MAG: prolyl oligopeptidase family serine peptidase [Bacteroidales bacterium]|nr:prolyl oligopeptidase family serine peptidase [Bacteroidales bacterium]
MRKILTTIVAIFTTFLSLFSQQNYDTTGNAEYYRKFAFRSFSNENLTLPYREARLCQDENGMSALVIFLHSSSHRGDDNKSQMRGPALKNIVNYLENNKIKSIVIAPQCDKNHFCNDSDSKASSTAKQLIDKLIADNTDIDSKRIYIFGYSSGGAGVWRMISDYPDTFAAAMAVASYPRNAYPKNIAQTALCCVMAGKDDKAKVSLVKPTIKETQKYGGTINFIVEKECDHISVCPIAFSDNNLKWVFDKRK